MRRLAVASAALALSACAGLKTGPAKGGEVVEVRVPAPGGAKTSSLLSAARREAVSSVLPAFLATDAPPEESLREGVLARAGELCGRASLVAKEEGTARARVLVKLDAVAAGLERLGAVRPSGFEAPPRVALALREADRTLGAGRASDAVRLSLLARGVMALDARDTMSGEKKTYKTETLPQALEAAKAMGAAFLLFGSAAAGPGDGEQWGIPAARGRVEATLVEVSSGTRALEIVKEASTVDLSMADAAGKALDEAGEAAADAAAAYLRRREGGRAELRVAVMGLAGLAEARELLTRTRRIPEVAGAALASMNGRAAVLRVFTRSLRADELGARLQRLPGSSLQVVEIEPDAGRVVLEVYGREVAD